MMAQQVRVASLRDLASASVIEFSVGADDWPVRGFVLRVDDDNSGAVRAYVNRCPHAGHALNLTPGAFHDTTGDYLICRSHGALFEPASGLCVAGPCPGKSLTRLECEIIGDDIYVAVPTQDAPASRD